MAGAIVKRMRKDKAAHLTSMQERLRALALVQPLGCRTVKGRNELDTMTSEIRQRQSVLLKRKD